MGHDNYKATIALIEAEPAIAEILTELLAEEGYHIRCYAHSADLLDHLTDHPADIVLLDEDTPACYNGWDAAAHLQRQGCLVVMVTTHRKALDELGRTPRARPFVGALAKPFDIAEIITILNRIWQRRPYATRSA